MGMVRRILLLASLLLLLLLLCCVGSDAELATRRRAAMLDDSAGRSGGALDAVRASGSRAPGIALADSATPGAAGPRRRTFFGGVLAESPLELETGGAAPLRGCTAQVNCSIGEYCAMMKTSFAYNCSACSFVDPTWCDALGDDCCSAAFMRQCPGDPYDCSSQLLGKLLNWIGAACGAVSGVWWLIRADTELLSEPIVEISAYCARTRSVAARWVAVLVAAVLVAVVMPDIGRGKRICRVERGETICRNKRTTVTGPLQGAAFGAAVVFLVFTATEAWTSWVLSRPNLLRVRNRPEAEAEAEAGAGAGAEAQPEPEPQPEPAPSPEPIVGRLTPGSRVWRGILLPALEAAVRLAVGPGVPALGLTFLPQGHSLFSDLRGFTYTSSFTYTILVFVAVGVPRLLHPLPPRSRSPMANGNREGCHLSALLPSRYGRRVPDGSRFCTFLFVVGAIAYSSIYIYIYWVCHWGLVSALGVGLLCVGTCPLVVILLKMLEKVRSEIGQNQWSKDSHDFLEARHDLLEAHKLRPVWFLRAYRWIAVLARIPVPFIQLPYMANEMHLFVEAVRQEQNAADDNTEDGDDDERPSAPQVSGLVVSCDGIRALAPVFVVLNLCFGAAMMLIPMQIMMGNDSVAPFRGILAAWSALAGLFTLITTCVLVHALSEPRMPGGQVQRQQQPESYRSSLLRQSVVDFQHDEQQRCCGCCCRCPPCVVDACKRVADWATSWSGQTQLSIANHLATITTLLYGLVFKHITDEGFRVLLLVAVGVSGLGIMISLVSLLERTHPQWKYLPSDDSFRVSCMIKTSLVIVKAAVVFEIDNHAEDSLWMVVVTVMFFTSFFVMALMTLALSLPKLWKHPGVLAAAGIEQPRVFLLQYAMSYVATKCAILTLSISGYAPDIFQCNETMPVRLVDNTSCWLSHGDPDYGPCTCSLDTSASTSKSIDCRSSFLSSETVTAVVLSMIWVPFAVYSNNEAAQLLDGLWWEHEQRQGSACDGGGGARRVGLSSASHGFRAVSPLVQSVVVVSVLISFSTWAPSGGIWDCDDPGYSFYSPQLYDGWPDGLRWFAASAVFIINGTMLLRVLLNCRCCYKQQLAASPEGALQQPILTEQPQSEHGPERVSRGGLDGGTSRPLVVPSQSRPSSPPLARSGGSAIVSGAGSVVLSGSE
eukprot:COSAG02_NODE_2954_length_7671_cov_103.987718_5_plen_1164_part_00